MTAPLDDIAFLSRSPARVAVLASLCEEPHTSGDLTASVDATRTTVGRAVDELESIGWVVRDGDVFEPTTLGALVFEDFDRLAGTVEAARELRDAACWLIEEVPRYGPERLGDAAVVVARRDDPAAPVLRAAELLGSASRVRALLPSPASAALAPYLEVIVGGGEFDAVLDGYGLDALVADSGAATVVPSAIEAGRATVALSPETVPHGIAIANDVVALLVGDADGTPRALVETADEAVFAAAVARFDALRAGAERLSAADVPGGRA